MAAPTLAPVTTSALAPAPGPVAAPAAVHTGVYVTPALGFEGWRQHGGAGGGYYMEVGQTC